MPLLVSLQRWVVLWGHRWVATCRGFATCKELMRHMSQAAAMSVGGCPEVGSLEASCVLRIPCDAKVQQNNARFLVVVEVA